jgi:hypothetical protein
MATGQFDPADGVTGTVELLVGEAGMTQIRITGFASTLAPQASLLLSPYPLTADRTCLDRFGFNLGSPSSGDDLLPVGDLSKFGGDDPSFIDGAVVAIYLESDHEQTGCGRTILATAPFTWTIPDMHPGLEIVDSGPAEGATGTVTGERDRLIDYTVASGDVISAIADRFGVTVDDLGYLNPFRGTGMAIADEIMNLDRHNRNAPWG